TAILEPNEVTVNLPRGITYLILPKKDQNGNPILHTINISKDKRTLNITGPAAVLRYSGSELREFQISIDDTQYHVDFPKYIEGFITLTKTSPKEGGATEIQTFNILGNTLSGHGHSQINPAAIRKTIGDRERHG